MKQKKLYQIKLFGPNSNLIKLLSHSNLIQGFVAAPVRCIPLKGIYNFFSTDGPTNLLIEAPFRSLKIGLHLNRFYVKFTSKSMYKKYIYTTLMKAKAIIDLKQKEQRQQIHNKRLLNSNLNHLILLDNTKNVTVIKITFNNDKRNLMKTHISTIHGLGGYETYSTHSYQPVPLSHV